MSTREEPVIVDGKLIGWDVMVEAEYDYFQAVGERLPIRVMTRPGGRFFMPVDWSPNDGT